MDIKAIVFDWGDTVMRDFPFPGAMKDWPFTALIPDVKLALSQLKDHFIIVMASNAGDSSALDIKEALKRENVAHLFHHVFSSKDIGCEKPDLGFFQFIENELQLNSNQLIMIGNNCDKDIKGAKNAGWNTIWFNENDAQNVDCSQADAIIFNMCVLTELIEKFTTHD